MLPLIGYALWPDGTLKCEEQSLSEPAGVLGSAIGQLARAAPAPRPRGRMMDTMTDSLRDFSQYGEQSIILDFLDNHPGAPHYCVDVGAFDGVTGSNSRALFLRGWSGVLIEPDPRTFAQLASLYAERPNVRCVRKAISDRTGLARMHFTDGPPGTSPEHQWHYAQVNTFRRRFADEYIKNHNYIYRTSWVSVTRLSRVLRRVEAPGNIGFMSIDCEGEDLKILKDLDFRRWRPQLLCIEADDASRGQFRDVLEPQGYRYHAHTVANTFFAP